MHPVNLIDIFHSNCTLINYIRELHYALYDFFGGKKCGQHIAPTLAQYCIRLYYCIRSVIEPSLYHR